jgi:hypothetical protein
VAYYLNLFSPETYEAFGKSERSVSGFRERQQNAADKIKPGDRLLCYMTRLSRWIGLLEVESEFYKDDTPIFYPSDDPFIIRFKVKTVAWLPKEKAIPIHDQKVWSGLSFTRGLDRTNPHWTGKFRNSLNPINDTDGRFLQDLIVAQLGNGQTYPIDEEEYERLITHKARRLDKVVTVSVPKDSEVETLPQAPLRPELRESIRIQALLANIGSQMGFKIWIPRNDRTAVYTEWKSEARPVIDTLPLNYDETTIKTIEQIDMLWLSGRSIVRAFEVEHTTSIYSGILRMADLLALQPNMNIKLHIVAPQARRDKVFQELLRPVFSLLDQAPLSERCTFISYDSVEEIAGEKHLAHLSDSVLDEYAEEAE